MKILSNQRNLFILLFVSCFLIFSGCSKDDNNNSEGIVTNTPGVIPGLGETDGALTGKAFKLPDGISVTGVIYGTFVGSIRSSEFRVNSKENTECLTLRASTANSAADVSIGSGYAVTVKIPLKNANAKSEEVVFPTGLILIAMTKDYQNGVLLKKASVTIPANETVTVTLVMYCGNLQRAPSFTDVSYTFGVVSNSSLIMKLCDKLVNKKINVEEFGAGSWMSNLVYATQVDKIQTILHNLTDRGIDLREEDIEYLEGLPQSN